MFDSLTDVLALHALVEDVQVGVEILVVVVVVAVVVVLLVVVF